MHIPVLVYNYRSRGCQISRGAQHGREVSRAQYGSRSCALGELELPDVTSPVAQRRNGFQPPTRTVLWLLSTFGTRLNQAERHSSECRHLHRTAGKCQKHKNMNTTQPPEHKVIALVSLT